MSTTRNRKEFTLAKKLLYFRKFWILRLFLVAFAIIFMVQIYQILQKWLSKPSEETIIEELRKTWTVQRSKIGSEMNTLSDLDDFQFLINNVSVCQDRINQKKLGSGIYFIILVHTAPEHAMERDLIRRTWGSRRNLKNWGIRLIFLMGKIPIRNSRILDSIHRESKRFRDIVMGSFEDSYRNLSYKHLMGYKWVSRFCPGAQFILKTDDDLFIDLFHLFDLVTSNYGKENQLLCYKRENMDPVRTSESNTDTASDIWTVTIEEYAHAHYPTFCGGIAYLVTPDYAFKILETSRKSRHFWIDDVYVTGILRILTPNVSEPTPLNELYSLNTFTGYKNWLNDEPGIMGKLRPLAHIFVEVDLSGKYEFEMVALWKKCALVWSAYNY